MAAVVAVHGIDQHQKGRNQLLTPWRDAMTDGVERATGRRFAEPLDLDVAFYGDLYLPLDDAITPTKSRGPRNDVERLLSDMDGDERDEFIEELDAEFADLTPDQAAGAAKGLRGVPRSLQAVLRTLDRNFGAAAGVLSLGVLKQVRRYLLDPELKARTDARVREAVGPDCVVLIGHSLGSVVAYEHLRQNGNEEIVLLTLGSPLGLRMVRDRLTVSDLPVPRWVAVRDPRDPVACAGDLVTWWPAVLDRLVDNGREAHAAERYLGKRVVGEVLHDTLWARGDEPS